MPIRTIITEGTTADCTKTVDLIRNFKPDHVIADRAYDSNEIVSFVNSLNSKVVIPPKKKRKKKRRYDYHLYKQRHLVENAFLHLKRWRDIATRYAKNTSSFIAIVQIRCLFIMAQYYLTAVSSATLISR